MFKMGIIGTWEGFIVGSYDIYNRGTFGSGYGISDVRGFSNSGSISTTNDSSAIKIKQSGVSEESIKYNSIQFRIYKPINLLSYKTVNFIVSGLFSYQWGYSGNSGANLGLNVYNDSSFSKSVASSMREFRFSSPNYTETTFSLDISNLNIPGYISIQLVDISDYSGGAYLYGDKINVISYVHKIWFT